MKCPPFAHLNGRNGHFRLSLHKITEKDGASREGHGARTGEVTPQIDAHLCAKTANRRPFGRTVRLLCFWVSDLRQPHGARCVKNCAKKIPWSWPKPMACTHRGRRLTPSPPSHDQSVGMCSCMCSVLCVEGEVECCIILIKRNQWLAVQALLTHRGMHPRLLSPS